jgi:uncharacterized protein YjbI with pentapeptide repeats
MKQLFRNIFKKSTNPTISFRDGIIEKINNGEKFSGQDLSGVVFDNLDLKNADFIDSILIGSQFIGSDLTGVKFYGANLTDTNFTDAILIDAKLQKINNHKTIIKRTIFIRTKLYGANLSNNDLRNIDLSTALFVPEDYLSHERVNLENVNLNGAILPGVDWRGVKLTGIYLEHADLTGANLTKAVLRDAHMTNAILKDTNLTQTVFTSAIMNGVDFTGAKLDNTVFLKSMLSHSKSLNVERIKSSRSKIRGSTVKHTDLSISKYKSPTISRTRRMLQYNYKQPLKESENCITILINAHGYVRTNKLIDKSLIKNVRISSIGGGIGINGIAGFVDFPVDPIPNKYDKSIMYYIQSNVYSSTAFMKLLYTTYPYLIEYYRNLPGKNNCSDKFYSIFKDLVYYIKQFHTNIDLSVFPLDNEDKFKYTRKRRESFAIFNSFNEKSFLLVPTPYDYCMKKTENGCQELFPEHQRDLEFGISILQSSDPYDQPYTLSGISMNNGDYRTANLSDWTQNGVRNYWRQKIENRRDINKDSTDEYLNLYDYISTPLDPEGMYSDPSSQRRVTLSRLLLLLKNGFGFTNINIIDVSCNSCREKISHLKRGVLDVIHSHPQIKEIRDLRNSVNNPSEWKRIKSPSFNKIVNVIGKAKSDSRGLKKNTVNTNRHSFHGGKTRRW